MSSNRDVQTTIRLYLLGRLDGGARDDFEKRLLTEDDLFDELLAFEDELNDEYLSSRLGADDKAMFEKNFLATPERQQKLRFARAFRKYAKAHASEERADVLKPARATWSWARLFSNPYVRTAAFASLIVLAAFGVWRIFFVQSDVDKALLALDSAYREQRPLESRITRFNYAPFGTTRGPGSDTVDQKERSRAELTLLEAIPEKPTPAAHHALGKVYLAKKDFSGAIQQFDEALKGDPNNAQIHADLGAAFLERGKIYVGGVESGEPRPGTGNIAKDLATSLEHLNKALQLDPTLVEALFNRALVYEYMLLPKQAIEAWKVYLEKDPNSQWAVEARRRIEQLEQGQNKPARTTEAILSGFATAYHNQDHDAAWSTISRHRDLTGGPVANTLIDQYLELAVSGQQDQALKKLDALSYVGQLERERAGDLYVSDMVGFLRGLPAAKRHSLVEARKLMKEGRESIFRSHPKDAVVYYTRARELLQQVGDASQSVYVDYPLGHSYLSQSKSRLSLANFEKVIAQCETRKYRWLMAQALNAKANVEIGMRNHSAALEASQRSLKLSDEIGDITGVIKTTNQLAQQYFYLGNYSKSLDLHQRSLELSEANWTEPIQVWRNYFSVPRTLNAMGLHSAAIEYEKEALRHAEVLKMPETVCRSYSILGLMYAGQGNYQEAVRNIEISIDLANRIPSEDTRKREIAYSTLQLGLVNRQAGEFAKAIANYDQALKIYGELEDYQPFIYLAHKGKLLACIKLEGCAAVEEEIRICLELFEEFRSRILEQSNRDSFFDTEQNVYDVAIGYEFSRKNFKTAFDYSERARARSLWDLANERATLAGDDSELDVRFTSAHQPQDFEQIKSAFPQAQILQYALLEERLLVWLISKGDLVHVTEVNTPPAFHEALLNYLELLSSPSSDPEALTRDGKTLYKTLIEPIEASLDKDKLLCIVPDKTLSYLPFGALISPQSGKYLVQDYEVMYAPSSTMFVRSSEIAVKKKTAGETLLAVGNPRFNQREFDLPDLPAAAKEVRSIKDLYGPGSLAFTGPKATRNVVKSEMGSADVVHFALHSVVDEVSPLRSKLVLASTFDRLPGDGVLHAYEIYGTELPQTRLVVLSACESGVGRYYRGEGMMGLSRTFIASGVPLVVSSLWRVDSESTAELMVEFHKNRKTRRLSTSKALQMAQQAMATGTHEQYRSPNYWAAFTLVGGYAEY